MCDGDGVSLSHFLSDVSRDMSEPKIKVIVGRKYLIQGKVTLLGLPRKPRKLTRAPSAPSRSVSSSRSRSRSSSTETHVVNLDSSRSRSPNKKKNKTRQLGDPNTFDHHLDKFKNVPPPPISETHFLQTRKIVDERRKKK